MLRYLFALFVAAGLAVPAHAESVRVERVNAAPAHTPIKSQENRFPRNCLGHLPDAYLSGASGTVVVTFRIGLNGGTTYVTVFKSSGNDELDHATVECAREWQYDPREYGVGHAAQVEWLQPRTADTYIEQRAHTCWIKPAILFKGAQGTTELSFIIDKYGYTKDIKIKQSSGHDDLDDAAARCAERWHYYPARKDGKPIAVEWVPSVKWVAADETTTTLTHTCEGFVPDAFLKGASGVTKLDFIIQPDGSITDISVSESSGHKDLDDAALACVKTWRYKPIEKDGHPVAAPWNTTVTWKQKP